jgi:integrase
MEIRKQTEQYGYVTGPRNDSYYLRYWSAPDAGGKRHRRAVEVGTKGQFANIDAAKYSVEAAELRRKINAGILSCTVGQVVATFERDALPARLNSRATALSCLEHIKAQWSEMPIAELASPTHAQQMVGWLNGLRSRRGNGAAPLSIEAKMRVKAQMSSIFTFAMTQGYISSAIPPMAFVHLGKGETPTRRQTLTIDQINAFLSDESLPECIRVMGRVAWLTGLRCSEIAGLRKEDFDLDKGILAVHRRIWHHSVDSPKSQKSGEPIPYPEELYEILSAWMRSPEFNDTDEGWMFAAPGGWPWSIQSAQQRYLRPWGDAHGIVKFGWHSFRHSYKQYLEDSGVSPEVVQRLMRHSSYRVTEGYGSGVKLDRLRAAQDVISDARPQLEVIKKQRQWA